ncbi:hypothetical protein MRB53_028109 [Persea americana]|uniref:Uncharacterized protein n=1 Tax=Persea americana TaxID=3435 RepID=A0ACC2KEM0_PERAE|nr:hypothetical protein MRB53_028109 [Persea americana]
MIGSKEGSFSIGMEETKPAPVNVRKDPVLTVLWVSAFTKIGMEKPGLSFSASVMEMEICMGSASQLLCFVDGDGDLHGFNFSASVPQWR